MIGLLAYGSLMHPAELAQHCTQTRSVPVRVRGFRRSFSQEPSWRAGAGLERGVLTVHESPRDWFNGILVCGSDADALRSIDRRERGYVRAIVQLERVEAYATHEIEPLIQEIGLYTGREEKWNDELLPNPAYLKLCIEAAERWGREFAIDFLRTTHVGGSTLEDFTAAADR